MSLKESVVNEKKRKRKYERKRNVSKLMEDKESVKVQKKTYDKRLMEAHTRYLSDLISGNSNAPKTLSLSLFKLIDSILSNS